MLFIFFYIYLGDETIRFFFCDFENKVDVNYARQVTHEYFTNRTLYYDPTRGIAKDSKNPSGPKKAMKMLSEKKVTISYIYSKMCY